MRNRALNQSSSERQPKHAVRDAFDRATRWFGNLLAPLVIITFAKDAQQAFEYLIAHPALTGAFALIFAAIFAYNILRNLNIEFGGWPWRREPSTPREVRKSSAPESSAVEATAEVRERSAGRLHLLRWVAVLGSLAALAVVIYVYVLVFVTGIYFVVVASAPDKKSAISEIQSLNRFFEANGYDLKARAHASTATGNPWYMISIDGWHTSREAAEATFREAKRALGPRMRSDAYIYSTENISPIKVLTSKVRRITSAVANWF